MDSAPTVAGLDIWTGPSSVVPGLCYCDIIYIVRYKQTSKQSNRLLKQNNGEQALVETLPIRFIVRPII